MKTIRIPQSEARLAAPRFIASRTIGALMLREMGTTYGQSLGGYIWAILEPLGAIILLSFGFSLIVRAPALGTSFILFYATGYLPFRLFTALSSKTGSALRYSRALLAYPRVIWLDAIIARAVLAILTTMMVFLIVIGFILMTVDAHVLIDFVPIIEGLGIMIVTGLGVGTLNALLFTVFPTWQQIWAILSRPLFLGSGVLFTFESLPNGAQEILWWNPLLQGIGRVRSGFYPTYEAEYVLLPYAFAIGLMLLASALVFLRKYHVDNADD